MKTDSSKNWLANICLSGLLAIGTISIVWATLNLSVLGIDVSSLILLSFGGSFVLVNLKTRQARVNAAVERKRAEAAEWELREVRHFVSGAEMRNEVLAQSYERFRRTAVPEGPTDLPNRKYIIEKLWEVLNEGPSARSAVLLLNLNRFRAINDTLGHDTGDRIIQQVAKRICETIGPDDVAGHLGGDEFAIILNKLDDPAAAMGVADLVAKRIGECVRFPRREVYTTASVGIVLGCSDYARPEDLLRDADIAMYNAKDSGKRCVIFDRTMYTRAVDRQQLETDLRYAIVCNELELFYQPIVRLEDAALCGCEALVRWNHPKKGFMSPVEFIPLAESTGLIIPMTVQILRSACTQLVRWQELSSAQEPLMVSVNLSVRNFSDPRLVDHVEAIIMETGVRPASLKLEITETAVMDNADDAIAILERLKTIGVSISIDDFGTGYSSLSFLHTFPLDHLKIDRSFVKVMGDANENRQIVRTIVALAKALDLEIIAEGIETKAQLKKLRRLGCHFGQGYLFSPPLPVTEFEPLLSDPYRWQNLLSGRAFKGLNSQSLPPSASELRVQ